MADTHTHTRTRRLPDKYIVIIMGMNLESVCDFVYSLQRLPDEMRWKRSFFIMQFKSHLLHLCAQLHFLYAHLVESLSVCVDPNTNIASIARTQNKWIICKVTDGGSTSTCPTGAQCSHAVKGKALWPMAVIGDWSECIERSANRQFFQNNTMRMLHIIFLCCISLYATFRRNQNLILEIPTARCEIVLDKLTMFRFACRLAAMRIIKIKKPKTEVSNDERKHSMRTTRKLQL